MREFPFALDPRLSAAAKFVRQHSRVVDVGTDHAYLPIWLVKKEICIKATGVDVNEKPLAKAREAVAKYRVEDSVDLVLSDGLKELEPGSFDDIIIAGMGGEKIYEIIDNAQWLRDPQKHLILQPMTNAHRLRKYLYENGFHIIAEEIVIDKTKMYTVMLVSYSGTVVMNPSVVMQYTGAVPYSNNKDGAARYLCRQAKSLKAIADGLKEADKKPAMQQIYKEAVDEILSMLA